MGRSPWWKAATMAATLAVALGFAATRFMDLLWIPALAAAGVAVFGASAALRQEAGLG